MNSRLLPVSLDDTSLRKSCTVTGEVIVLSWKEGILHTMALSLKTSVGQKEALSSQPGWENTTSMSSFLTLLHRMNTSTPPSAAQEDLETRTMVKSLQCLLSMMGLEMRGGMLRCWLSWNMRQTLVRSMVLKLAGSGTASGIKCFLHSRNLEISSFLQHCTPTFFKLIRVPSGLRACTSST